MQAPPRVEAALLQELRRQKAVSARKEQWWMALLGAAAVAVLVLGLSVRHAHIARREAPMAGNGATGHSTLGRLLAAARRRLPRLRENVSSDSQDATAFVSLPYATDPATLEGGTVVRVELSRSALASMGMPVDRCGRDGPDSGGHRVERRRSAAGDPLGCVGEFGPLRSEGQTRDGAGSFSERMNQMRFDRWSGIDWTDRIARGDVRSECHDAGAVGPTRAAPGRTGGEHVVPGHWAGQWTR